ncbi:MAG TPA: hypothetical protein GXZ80_05465 [Euryarchaeota archaeon]|nr:hypothetical protein [Euryarchaeota archaeon]
MSKGHVIGPKASRDAERPYPSAALLQERTGRLGGEAHVHLLALLCPSDRG